MSGRLTRLAAQLAAGLFAAALTAAPAMAQKALDTITEAQRGEMLCIYNEVASSELLYEIGDTYLLFGDVSLESEEGKKLLEVEKGCTAKHGWDSARSELASAIAIVGASSDLLMEEDLLELDDAQIDAVFQTIDEIGDADYQAFVNGAWDGDMATEARVIALLKENGFPAKDDDQNYSGMLLMEVNILGAEMIDAWIASFVK